MNDGSLQDDVDSLVESAPCGYVATRPDGTIIQVNAAFEAMLGIDRVALQGVKRFVDLLPVGDRMFHETHYLPTLHLHGRAREIAFALVRPDGVRVPVLVNAVMHRDADGTPRAVRAMVFDASDRRRYEEGLLLARRQEQHVARRLQASFLAGDVPADPRVALHAFYRAAEAGLDVGGDWHDAFWIDEGEVLALVVGDVVGHGLEAAATMGQLRSALRALAGMGLPPGATLTALDAFVARHAIGRMTTVVYAQLDLRRGLLHHASAGHPPPLVAPAGTRPRFEWEARGVPLDCAATPAHRGTATLALGAGATVLLYSDGVIEDRARTLDEGLQDLLTGVADGDGLELDALTDRLARSLGGDQPTDDICLLTARLR